jgi:hypothetical protein
MPEVSTPQYLRPPVAAFGIDVAEAVESLGQTGQKIAGAIAKHGLTLQQEEQDKEVIRRETAFRQDMQNRAFNDDVETIKIAGQDVQRPKGFLSRQLGQAKGVTQEFDQLYLKNIRDQYLAGLSKYQVDKLGPVLDNYATSLRGNIISHEAAELKKDFEAVTKANVAQKISEASTIRDPKSLGLAIDGAIEAAKPYNSRFHEAIRKINNQKIIGDMVESSVVSTLRTTGNLEQAQSLLDSAKDRMTGDEKYIEIKSRIAKEFDAMQAEAERVSLENRVADRFKYIAQIGDGSLNWENATETIRDVATKDPELAEAMKKVFESKGGYYAEEIGNEGFQNLANDIFKAKDTESISKFLIRALKENKNISRDRLAILVDAARERAKELPLSVKGQKAVSPKRSFWDSAWDAIMLSNPLTAPFVLMSTVGRAKAENAQGEQILNIANDEIRKQRIKDNPVIATLPAKGRLLMDRYGNKAIVYPDGSYEEVMSKTGEFKHKEQRKREQPEEK